MTISYGRWSNEVFFLFFGFLPEDNPWDSITVFRDLPEMIAYHDDLEVRLCAILPNTKSMQSTPGFSAMGTSGHGGQRGSLPG